MDMRKLKRFDRASAFLACPVCGEPLVRDGRRLICQHGHSFDIARQGYVNLLRGGGRGGAHEDYGRRTFEMRRRVFDAGLYDPIGPSGRRDDGRDRRRTRRAARRGGRRRGVRRGLLLPRGPRR